MKIIPLKYYDGGFMTQAFAFGGSRDKAQIDPNVRYDSSLQNFLIDDGSQVILVDTGLPENHKDTPKKEDAPLWMGDKVGTFTEVLLRAGYAPESVSKVVITHKHPDHTGTLGLFDHAEIYISEIEADKMHLTGSNVVRVHFTDGPFYNFPESQRITEQLVMLRAEGHTLGNSIFILQEPGANLYYMFHGDVTYCDAALKENELSVVFEDKARARETLDRVREFIRRHPTVYCSTHCPEGYLNLEQRSIMQLDS